jgi:DNA replication and repair protein RecF
MAIERLSIQGFRCFDEAEPSFGDGWNLIWGENASGKTSLLEAFYFLGRGRSFRTARTERLIREGARRFRLVGRLRDGDWRHVLGVEWARGESRWRLDGRDLNRLAEAATVLPVLSIDAGVHALIDGGPEHRRRFLDWGLFHVEPGFLPAWQAYRRCLEQRNRALRQKAGQRILLPWDRELVRWGEEIDQHRRRYAEILSQVAARTAGTVLGDLQVAFDYQGGWRQGEPLKDALARVSDTEREQGFTMVGPHRAELGIRLQGEPAREWASRGQQKLLAGTLVLAAARLFIERTGRRPVILVDDLPAELDRQHLERFISELASLKAQRILTTVSLGALEGVVPAEAKVFHVEHGRLA